MSRSHPGLDRAEGMLDSLSSDTHHVGGEIKPGLHLFEQSFVLPARYPAFGARSAFVFQRALLALRTPVAIKLQATFGCCIAPYETLACRTSILVLLGIVDEIVFA